jgi:hypothetical protein
MSSGLLCRHDVHKRMHGERGVPKAPRYILWGEGTTDEMCPVSCR